MYKANRIRHLLKEKGLLVMPGVYDALSAKIAARAGFEVLSITGYGLSATSLGEPDFGILTQTEMLFGAGHICSVVDVPVIVDAGTGYGNAINIVRTVKELVRVGAGGMFLEDQVWPKCCGHMKGKQVIPLEEQLKKLRAAIEAREAGELFIVGRTDARQALGLEEAISRAIAFKEVGVDAVFIEAPESKEEMREIARNVPGPLVANMIEQGVTPVMGPDELRELGFQLIVWPSGPLFASAKALQDTYTTLRQKGTTREIFGRLISFDEFHEIVGLEQKYVLDAQYKS